MNHEIKHPIPIIDIFAGPGGLGEGFSSLLINGQRTFKVALSIEKDEHAYSTLRLRSFFRQFNSKSIPDEYYRFARGEITEEQLFRRFPIEALNAEHEAWRHELASVDDNDLASNSEVDQRIIRALGNSKHWILIGGPPCQAYSTVGRSRNKAIYGYEPEKDKKHFLYKEYLRIISSHWPAVFVMENVQGILSAKINGDSIFKKIFEDLKNPGRTFNSSCGDNLRTYNYRIYSLVKKPDYVDEDGFPVYKDLKDFTIKCENHGIPQSRHRVILIGIRQDINKNAPPLLKVQSQVPVENVLKGLPRLRSGFSRGEDNSERWISWLTGIENQNWLSDPKYSNKLEKVKCTIKQELNKIKKPKKNRGGEFIVCKPEIDYLRDWFLDNRLGGVCNSTTRGHMDSDLIRYFFSACFAKVYRKSPVLNDYPIELLPNHKNARNTHGSGNFGDRFRVQVSDKPSTTIMSHLSRDGHYYIHYDPTQCRSITVREAARIQTFPDNYYFCGSRTHQYIQVGNAVPPYLAYQIAEIIYGIFRDNWKKEYNGSDIEGKTQLEYVKD